MDIKAHERLYNIKLRRKFKLGNIAFIVLHDTTWYTYTLALSPLSHFKYGLMYLNHLQFYI